MKKGHASGDESQSSLFTKLWTAFLSSCIPLAVVAASTCTANEGLVLSAWGVSTRAMPYLETIVFIIAICALMRVYRRYGLPNYLIWTACFILSVIVGLQFVNDCQASSLHGRLLSLEGAVLLNYLAAVMFGVSVQIIRRLRQR